MEYATALKLARDSLSYLEENEGNMSHAELIVHTAALDYAAKAIAKRNGIVLPSV